jgi:hypothetical protein
MNNIVFKTNMQNLVVGKILELMNKDLSFVSGIEREA